MRLLQPSLVGGVLISLGMARSAAAESACTFTAEVDGAFGNFDRILGIQTGDPITGAIGWHFADPAPDFTRVDADGWYVELDSHRNADVRITFTVDSVNGPHRFASYFLAGAGVDGARTTQLRLGDGHLVDFGGTLEQMVTLSNTGPKSLGTTSPDALGFVAADLYDFGFDVYEDDVPGQLLGSPMYYGVDQVNWSAIASLADLKQGGLRVIRIAEHTEQHSVAYRVSAVSCGEVGDLDAFFGADTPCDGDPSSGDTDGDSTCDAQDLCPLDPENDADLDGVCEFDDNCAAIANPDQNDADGDGQGDDCDADDDGDAAPDLSDNCPYDANPGQQDSDGDGAGDACDADSDDDGVIDAADACLGTFGGEAVDEAGCSIDDRCPCAANMTGGAWKNHGAYVSCISQTATRFERAGRINASQRSGHVSRAGGSSCGS